MALVKCPWCGLTISEGISICPHCGKPTTRNASRNVAAPYNQSVARPPQTTSRYSDMTDIDDDDDDDDEKRSGSKVAIIIIAVLLVIAVPLGVFGYLKHQKEVKREEYINNLFIIKTQMLLASATAEDAASLVHDVWYNTIYEKRSDKTDPYTMSTKYRNSFNSDFNDSLRALYVSDLYQKYIEFIEDQSEEIADLFGELQNPPEELASAYSTLDSMYDAYQTLTTCATNPSGSLLSYTQQFESARDDFLKYYEKLEAIVPETNIKKRADALS